MARDKGRPDSSVSQSTQNGQTSKEARGTNNCHPPLCPNFCESRSMSKVASSPTSQVSTSADFDPLGGRLRLADTRFVAFGASCVRRVEELAPVRNQKGTREGHVQGRANSLVQVKGVDEQLSLVQVKGVNLSGSSWDEQSSRAKRVDGGREISTSQAQSI